MKQEKLFTIRNIAIMGMMSALATVLMLFEFPLPFIAPPFYKLDLSEIPVLIGSFMLGPVAGVITELIKIALNLLINGTETAFVGEFANFTIGCALVVPASIIYRHKKSRKTAIIGMIVGSIFMAIAGIFINAYVMLPFFSQTVMPMENIIAMGTAIHPSIDNVLTFCLLTVAPFNALKGILVSIVTILIYKKISILLKGNH
ncbi:MAG: ECF transporter S component [Lachnospiraceae bacterium]|nr:ECF transporter S component [Lachnospiraceae bacterium]